MLYELLEKTEILSPLFYQFLYMSIIGSIVGLIVYFIRNLFDKKMSGQAKCILWCIVLVVFLLPIRFEIQTNYTYENPEIVNRIENVKNIGSYNNSNIDINTNQNTERTSNHSDKKQIISAAKNNISVKDFLINSFIPMTWIAGVIITLITYLAALIKLRKKIYKTQFYNERISKLADECKKQLNIKKDIKIILHHEKSSPGIFGTIKPCILLNDELLQKDSQTIKYIFLHELSHYKRKDMLFNYLLLLTVAMHWFNPIIWFLFKKIRQDIELGADELAAKKLTKHERKEYAMVLIHSLKNYSEEHSTANMLCISDTEKNMKRRISMLKGKRKNLFIGLLIIVVVIGAVTATVFLKSEQTAKPESSSNTTKISQHADTAQSTAENNTQPTADQIRNTISDKEKSDLENYVLDICNRNLCNRLPEFDNINDADKAWIYSHITRKDNVYAMTEREITEDLQNQFGSELTLNVKNDTASTDNIAMPTYNKEENDYTLPAFGMDNSVCYMLNSIKKSGNKYTVTVIEYNLRNDLTTNETVLGAYDDSIRENWKWKEIHRGSSSETNEEMVKKIVLEKKTEFQSFKITLEKNSSENFIITQSKMI